MRCPTARVLVVELMGGARRRGCIPTARRRRSPSPGGSPNGAGDRSRRRGATSATAAAGTSTRSMGMTIPDTELPADYTGGRIERVDLDTGDVKVLYTECDGHQLDRPERPRVRRARRHVVHRPRQAPRAACSTIGAIYYAQPDGSSIREVVFPSRVAERHRPLARRRRACTRPRRTPDACTRGTSPARARSSGTRSGAAGAMLCGLPGMQLFDSLGVDSDGNVVVATLVTGALTRDLARRRGARPGALTGDPMVTNVCFGGPDLRTAYVTCSATGRLVSMPWPRPGLALAYVVARHADSPRPRARSRRSGQQTDAAHDRRDRARCAAGRSSSGRARTPSRARRR